MQIHLVGGFLGSGKTTAITAACKSLSAHKITAGVITNDQGKYMVDTAFYDLQKTSAVQVSNGCFCCNYDDLTAKIDQLEQAVQPDVIFAESVGSCIDIVATVLKPLQEIKKIADGNITFTVFADTRLFSLWAAGDGFPFGNKIAYLYAKQMEEAGLLVLNKRDLISPERARQAMDAARNRFPAKQIRLQNSLDLLHIDSWLDELDAFSKRNTSLASLQIDYDWYAAGEAALAWLDTDIDFFAPDVVDFRHLAIDWITSLDREFRQRSIVIAHLKVIMKAGTTEAKVSLMTGDAAGWRAQVPEMRGRELRMLVNIRAEADPVLVRELVFQTARAAGVKIHCQVEEKNTESIRPDYPKPKRRMP